MPADLIALSDFNHDLTKGTNRRPDLMEIYKGAFARSVYGSVHRAALIKSTGNADELGYVWLPLKRRTKAYGKPSLRSGLSLPGPKMRPTLTPAQDQAWKKKFFTTLKNSTKGLKGPARAAQAAFTDAAGPLSLQGNREARRIAAAVAWNHVKSVYGATTLIAMIGDAEGRIMYETGRLIASVEPTGFEGPYRPSEDQKFISLPGASVRLGSNVPYAGKQHGRTLFPSSLKPWILRANEAGIRAVIEAIT